jgi:hypothetical protein
MADIDRVEIPVQELPANGGVDTETTWTAADATNDHFFVNTGREVLLMKNTDGNPHTAMIISVPNQNGRSGDKSFTVAAAKQGSAGFFRQDLFGQRSAGFIGRVFVNLAGGEDAGVSFAVIRYLL